MHALTVFQQNFAVAERLLQQYQLAGDELLLRESPERINLSFEALEVLLSRDLGSWRVYGGGDYLLDPPWGQLYKADVSYVGAGFHLGL